MTFLRHHNRIASLQHDVLLHALAVQDFLEIEGTPDLSTIFHSQEVYLCLFGKRRAPPRAGKRFEHGHIWYQRIGARVGHLSYEIDPLAVNLADDDCHLRVGNELLQSCRNLCPELHRSQSGSLYVVKQRHGDLAVRTNWY